MSSGSTAAPAVKMQTPSTNAIGGALRWFSNPFGLCPNMAVPASPKDMVQQHPLAILLVLPTPDAFINLGILSFVTYFLVEALMCSQYWAYVVSIAFCIIYLGLILVVKPRLARVP